jgi:Fic family protein
MLPMMQNNDSLIAQQILACLSAQGAALRELEQRLGQETSKRTLQRALNDLLAAGTLERRGKGRAVRYYPVTPLTHATAQTFPLAADSLEVRNLIRRPVQERTPVGYDIDVLRRYQPNETFYLSAATRVHLRRLGETGEERLPAGTYGRQVLHRLLIDLSWASSSLEGNTYSRLDTERLIAHGEIAAGKDALETQMILNHKAAIEFLVDNADDTRFHLHTFLNLHGLLSEGLMLDPSASGRLRSRPVDIGGSVYKPHALPQVIADAFREILEKAGAITDPFEQAFFLMVQIPYLQPFEDVNKRVSRLAANIPLLRHNLCPLTFLDVPERAYIDGYLAVYELSRIEILRDVFVWAYERSVQEYLAVRKTLTPPDPLRLKYRAPLHTLIHQIVTENIGKPLALIDQAAEAIPEEHRAAFTDMVLDDLKRLHEGVLARYRIQAAAFETWKQTHHDSFL